MNITISSEMFDAMIDHLIGARNRMTDRVDERIDFRAVDHIDAVLSTVPHGARADVDALLGRKRIVMVQHRDGTREIDSIGFSEEHKYLECRFGYNATGLIDGIKHHSECTREIDPALMTMPEVLAGRAAAGLRDAGEMQREMGAAMKQAASIMENTMRSFEVYNKSQEEA